MLELKSGKLLLTDGMEIPNQDKIRKFGEKGTYKYLGISEADTIHTNRDEIKHSERISQENQKATRD